jgi:two-component system phosphate regulon sensor histidine kinase PhoR
VGRLPRTITGRILVAAGAGLVAGFLVIAISAPILAQQHDTETLQDWLRSEAKVVASQAADAVRGGDTDAVDLLAHRIARAAGVRVTIVAMDGVVIGESDEDRHVMENHATRPEVAPALQGGEGSSIRHSATIGRDLLYVAVPIRDNTGAVIGVARTALPVTELQSLAARLGGAIIFAGLASAGVALVVVMLLSRSVTRPILTLAARAERLAEGVEATFAIEGPDEMQRLGSALRRMSVSIEGARDAAERERDRLATLIEELGEAVLLADGHGTVIGANRAFERIFGVEARGQRVVEVVREHELLEAIASARVGAEAVATIERAEPRTFLRAIARRLEDGELLVVVQDLSDVRRLETVRRDFVANISHELRTPIASLKAMAETLEAGALDDRVAARDFVSRMHAEIEDLAQLVEELLTLGRLESAELELHRRKVVASDLVVRARERMEPLAERAGQALDAVVASDLPAVDVDPDRIAQVFANLIHNAVKYTPRGGRITLSAARADGSVAFSVSDTGQGISSAELPRIFERFYKGDRARSSPGTGLGLAIAKHIVQAHGGTIEAASDGPGRGSRFTFTLPT